MTSKAYNANPSRDLSYTSLLLDEQNRAHHAHKITDTVRFKSMPRNGNLPVVVPEAPEDPAAQEALPRHLQVNTNTRTTFQDVFYSPKEGIAEYVEDPSHTVSSIRAQPHMALSELAPTDTRIRRHRAPYESPLGPGYYEPDPLGERATGPLAISPGEVHHVVQYARDPTRPSAVFVSAPRGRTAQDISAEAVAPPICSRMTDLDFEYWGSKGCWQPRAERVIEAERWGKNVREWKPPADERPQTIYAPAVTTNGSPSSCEAYTAARLSPAYKTAFASGLPRTLALPHGNKPDTRLQVRSYQGVTAAGPDVGPGSYNPEAPRMRSSNAAYESSSAYYSLASGSPGDEHLHTPGGPRSPGHHSSATPGSTAGTQLSGLLPPQLQQQLIASGAWNALLPSSAPVTPSGGAGGGARGLLSAGGLLAPSGRAGSFLAPLAGTGHMSEPSSPSAQRAAAVRAERAAATALLSSFSGSHGPGGGAFVGGGSSGGAARAGRSPRRGLLPSPLGAAAAPPAHGMHHHSGQPHEYAGEEDGVSLPQSPGWQRTQSAPVSPGRGVTMAAAMRAAQAKQNLKLVFNQRHTPCSSMLKSHLIVAADLRRERQRLRTLS